MRDDVQVLHMRDLLIQVRQLVEVGCEETKGVDLRGNVPGTGFTVNCRLGLEENAHLL